MASKLAEAVTARLGERGVDSQAMIRESQRVPGKRVGGTVYVHRSALERSRIPKDLVQRAMSRLPEGWDFAVVRWDSRTGEVAFLQSPDWDLAPEPEVGDLVAVLPDGSVRTRRASRTSPQIYHHKWMFVADDYPGFDVAESKARSRRWEALDPDRRRIGYKAYWEREVLPRL